MRTVNPTFAPNLPTQSPSDFPDTPWTAHPTTLHPTVQPSRTEAPAAEKAHAAAKAYHPTLFPTAHPSVPSIAYKHSDGFQFPTKGTTDVVTQPSSQEADTGDNGQFQFTTADAASVSQPTTLSSSDASKEKKKFSSPLLFLAATASIVLGYVVFMIVLV